jgi:hypothetical protein
VLNRTTRIAILLVIAFPIVLNVPQITGLVKADPALLYSGLRTSMQAGPVAGSPVIDPSIGYFHEALGKRAMDQMSHGEPPWWNSFEGAGVPLAGEMNSSPFFPLMPLLELPRGQVLIQVMIQILSGLGVFALLKELRASALAALFGALLFETNGTIAWLGGGWIYPMPCLPLLLFGIERIRSADRRAQLQGGFWIAIALAVSISAGFIEISYLDGLLGVAWSAVRFLQMPGAAKVAFAGRLVAAGAVGIALSAPILIAFFDYTAVAVVGGHVGYGKLQLDGAALVQKFLPYVWGPISKYAGREAVWGSTGGYVGFGVAIVAVCGLLGPSQRALRILLGAWIVLAVGATFGSPLVSDLAHAIPGVRFTAYIRYFDTSWALAIAVLAALGLDDLRAVRWPAARERILAGIVVVGALCWMSLRQSWADLPALWNQAGFPAWFVTSLQAAVALAGALLLIARDPRGRRRATAIGCVLALEAAAYFTLHTLAYPTRGSLATGGVAFLARNIGLARSFSLGPMAPNYGSYYGIAAINYNDIPMASLWVAYVRRHLDRYAEPLLFTGTFPRSGPTVPNERAELRAHVAEYQRAGVKYVLTAPGQALADDIPAALLVYRDAAMDVYELPHPRPYFSAKGCSLDVVSRTAVNARCGVASVLTRLELFMPGWSATVGARAAPIALADEAFQAVELPAGTSTVAFSFTPPHIAVGYACFALALSITMFAAALGFRRGRYSTTNGTLGDA